jgi:tRNA pseudouridine55 synthase
VTVTVHRLDVLSFDGDSVRIAVEADAGFYVRSLAHDLGVAVGGCAVLDQLRRTRAGEFALDRAIGYEELVMGARAALLGRMVPFDALLRERPAVVLDAESVKRIQHGLDVGPFPSVANPPVDEGRPIRLMDGQGRLVALGQPAGAKGFLHPSVVFG